MVGPPLVGFVTRTHAGYCQYFAGAMALMLRYLGIPARVAVGFAGGTYDPKQHVWNVTDREAHAWVEVWFKGYGWLPFDPTPAAPGAAPRQTLAGVPAAGGAGARGSICSSRGRSEVPPAAQAPAEQKLKGVNGFAPIRSHQHAGSGRRRCLGSSGSTIAAGRCCSCSPASRPWRQPSC